MNSSSSCDDAVLWIACTESFYFSSFLAVLKNGDRCPVRRVGRFAR
jgi:hypothetical protein